MVPVLVLAVIAVVIIKSLMSVVARDEATTLAPWSPDPVSMPTYEASYDATGYDPTAYDPTVRLRATVNDDVRGFLLPAAPESANVETVEIDETVEAEQHGATEQTRSHR